MANIAQIVNVLQSMILTDQIGTGHMVLTPTYHVFEMYRPFQEATFLPIDLQTDVMQVSKAYFKNDAKGSANSDTRPLPLVSASAARTQDGSIILSLTNVSLDRRQTLDIALEGVTAKQVSGRILTSKNVADFNTFERPNVVVPQPFSDAKIKKGRLSVTLPAKSIVVLTLK